MNLLRSTPATALLLLTLASAAQALTLDFEDLPTNGFFIDAPTGTYQGFEWNKTLDAIDITEPGTGWGNTGPAHSGQNAILNNYGGNGEMSLASGTFTLDSLWIRTWYGVGSREGSLLGYNQGLLVYTNAFTFGTEWTSVAGSSAELTRLVIAGGNFFLVDDITVNSSPTAPVPDGGSTIGLLGMVLTGMAWVRRKLA